MSNENESSTVSFLLIAPLKDVCFNPLRTAPLKFKSELPELTVQIRSASPSNDDEHVYDNLECVTACELSTSAENSAFVAALTEGEYLPIAGAPVTLPVRVKGEERIDASGIIREGVAIPFELYPRGVQELWERAHGHLLKHQERFLRLLRWSQAIQGPHNLYESSPSLYWAADHGTRHYHVSSPEASPQSGSVHGIVWEKAQQELLRKLWDQEDVVEPLGHELLREATTLAGSYLYSDL